MARVWVQMGSDACVVVEAAVMMEAGWDAIMDEVWVVAVEPEIARCYELPLVVHIR
jgi:dephospho-CoA kinase